MKKIYILYSFLIMMPFSIKAQEYKLFGVSEGNKVHLKWMSKNIGQTKAVDVYRSSTNGEWEKMNNEPIVSSTVITVPELNTSKNKFPNDKSYEYYIKARNSKETNPNKKAYESYQLSLAAIYDSQVAKHLGIYFEDKSVVLGKKYTYKVVDIQSGKEIAVLNELVVGELALAPENCKVIQEKQNVKLSWKNNPDFIGCNIYRNGKKINIEPVMANLENGTYQIGYIDTNLDTGNYSYIIKGVTFLNTESQPTAEIKIVVKDAIPPSAVKGVKAERNDDEVVLSWLASKENDLNGYNVLKSNDKGKTFAKLNSKLISDVKYVEKLEREVTSGTFYYQIEAVDRSNNASKSTIVSVFMPDHYPPAMPKEVSAKSERGKITLSWSPNKENDLAGYRIYRGLKDDDENEMLLLNVSPQAETTFVDTFNVKAGTKFIYKVTAVDKAFNESSHAVLWVQLPDVIPPSAPFLHEATYDNNQINLKWDTDANDEILGYEIYRVYEGKEEKINNEPIRGNVFQDSNFSKRGIVQYYIKAIDSAKLVSKPSNKIYVSTAAFVNDKIRIVLSQDVRAKKVTITYDGLNLEDIQTIKLFRKSDETGFLRVPLTVNQSRIIDETSEENKIYEYYLEIVTKDNVRIKSEKATINNTF